MTERDIGAHGALIDELLERTARMEKTLREIELLLAERRGERKVVLWIASTASACMGALFTVGFKFLSALLARAGS